MLSKRKKREFLKLIQSVAGKDVDVETGDVRTFKTIYEKNQFIDKYPGRLVHFRAMPTPQPTCKKCFGRGYTAVTVKDKHPVVCSCVRKLARKK